MSAVPAPITSTEQESAVSTAGIGGRGVFPADDPFVQAVREALERAERHPHPGRELSDEQLARVARSAVAKKRSPGQTLALLRLGGFWVRHDALEVAMREAEIERPSAEIGCTMADRWGPGVGAAAGKVAGQFLAAVDRERQRRQEAEGYELAHQVKLVFDEVLGPARPRRAPRVRLRSCPRPRSSRGARAGRRRAASRAGPDDDGGGEPGEPPPAPPRGHDGGSRSRDPVERAGRGCLRRAPIRAEAGR